MQAVILAIVLPVLRVLFAAVTPQLREVLAQYLRDLYSKALASASPWDDFAIGVLCGMTGVSTEGVVAAAPAAGVQPVTMPVQVSKAILGSSFTVTVTSQSTPSGSTGTITNPPPGPMPIPGMNGA